jgi:hypothetical protein
MLQNLQRLIKEGKAFTNQARKLAKEAKDKFKAQNENTNRDNPV